MTLCKSCSREISTKAKSCPGCGAKNGKLFYKKWWFILLAIFIVIGAIGSQGETPTYADNSQVATDTAKPEEEKPKEEKPSPTPEVPTEYKSALKKAKIYSDSMSMSKKGLYEQLTSQYGEKFSAEAAQYAIDKLK